MEQTAKIHTKRVRFNKQFFRVLDTIKQPDEEYTTEAVDGSIIKHRFNFGSEGVYNIHAFDGSVRQIQARIMKYGNSGIIIYLQDEGKLLFFFSERFLLIKKRAEKFRTNWSPEVAITHELLQHYIEPDYNGSIVEEFCCDTQLCSLSDEDYFNFKDRDLKQDRMTMGDIIFNNGMV